MTDFTFTSPEGKTYTVTGPDGATKEQAFQILQAKIGGGGTPEPSVTADVAKEGGKGLLRGVADFAGDIGEAVMGPFGPSHHAANLMADFGLGERPPPEPGYSQQIAHATGIEASPQTGPGKYAGAVGETLGNPASYLGPGSAALKIGAGTASALGSEAAGQLTDESPTARFVGGMVGGVAAASTGGAVRGAVRPETNMAADLARAMKRDGDTVEALEQRLRHARAVRPNATLADVAGENVRGLVERVAQTPGGGRAKVVPRLKERQQQQLTRLSDDLEGLTGARKTAVQATQQTMASRAETATPLYQQAYADGDRAIWSPELERLSSSPTVEGAMRGAVTVWRDNVIADGYGAMNPGAMVDRGGILSFPGGKLPAFPNLQFWDYTKRIIDEQIEAAVSSGQNQKARTLTMLVQPLRTELDRQVPSYAAARNAWGGPSQYIRSIEDGGKILERSLSGEQLRANLAEMTDAQKEGYLIGAVSSIMQRMRSDPAKLPDLTKYLRSPEMRDKITALMPTPEAATKWLQALDYEVGSSELTGQALKGPATYRRLAERQDADSISGDLVAGALTHGPTLGLLRKLLVALPARVRDSLRSRSDALLADVLVNPQADVGSALRGAPSPSVRPAAARALITSPMDRLYVSPLSQPSQ